MGSMGKTARPLEDVLEAMLPGVVVADRRGVVEELNSVACRMLEHSREAVAGRPVEELVTADHPIARLARQALASGAAVSAQGRRIERRRDALVVDVSAAPLFSAAGALGGVVVLLQSGAAQQPGERFLSLGRIAAGLAHEVRNPLGGIRGAGELIAMRAADAKTRAAAEIIVAESTRIAALVDDFMVFARGDRLRLAPINLHRLLDGVLELLSHDPLGAAVQVKRNYDASLPELLADGDRLRQVFLNLARNALQAMAQNGGELSVRTGMSPGRRIALQRGRPLPTLAVWVEDTGHGMSEEELREARTPFFTTRGQGAGLGLAVAEYWVAQHQGDLQLQSTKGVGTRARVTLPLRRTP